jgi:hypothetical protein
MNSTNHSQVGRKVLPDAKKILLKKRAEKQYHTIWVCVVALGIYHAMCMRYVVMWSGRLYHIFPHYLVNGTIFGKTLWNIKYLFRFSLQLSSEKFFIVRTNRNIIKKVYWSSCELSVILVRF